MSELGVNDADPGKVLGFTEEWWALGIVSAEQVERLVREFRMGDDPQTEHYRYHAFCEYLAAARPLSPTQAEALFELGDRDPDLTMGAAMKFDIVSLAECPESLRERVLASGDPQLVKLVTRLRLLEKLRQGVSDQQLDDLLTAGDGALQRELVERFELSPAQLERLVQAGASRAVRNLALIRLRKVKAAV